MQEPSFFLCGFFFAAGIILRIFFLSNTTIYWISRTRFTRLATWPAERIWDRIRAEVLAVGKNISVTEGAAQAPVEPLGRAGSVGNDFPRRLRVTFKKVLLNRSKFSCRNRFSRLGARPGRETPNSISARRKGRKGASG